MVFNNQAYLNGCCLGVGKKKGYCVFFTRQRYSKHDTIMLDPEGLVRLGGQRYDPQAWMDLVWSEDDDNET